MHGHVTTIYIKSDNGLHVAGYTIHPPYHDSGWEVYSNDGSGNGDFMAFSISFASAMEFVTSRCQMHIEDFNE